MTIHLKVPPHLSRDTQLTRGALWLHPRQHGVTPMAPIIDTALPRRAKSLETFLSDQTCWSQSPLSGARCVRAGSRTRTGELVKTSSGAAMKPLLLSATLSGFSSAPGTWPNVLPLGDFTQGVPE